MSSKKIYILREGTIQLLTEANKKKNNDVVKLPEDDIPKNKKLTKEEKQTLKNKVNKELNDASKLELKRLDDNIERLLKRDLQTGSLSVSKIYYFFYHAKGEGELEVYDKNPLVIPLDIYMKTIKNGETNKYLLAVNFHWIKNTKQRQLIFNHILSIYGNSSIKISTSNKSVNIKKLRLLYQNIKSDPYLKPCLNAIRLYIVDRITSLKIVPMKYYPLLFTKASLLRARFAYKTKDYKVS